MHLYPALEKTIRLLTAEDIAENRKTQLQPLIDYIQESISSKAEVRLNFICTHNSRRSQFAQIWAQTAAAYHNINARCHSGGVEITEFNERAVASLKDVGFQISFEEDANPLYSVSFSREVEPLKMFSKLYNDPTSPTNAFATVMTCSDADENCPVIVGAEKRLPLTYEDPKAFDNTLEETAKYKERSIQIATEMFYVFSKIKH